jgi:DNA polymerase III epsilon subunit-like protein
MFGILKFKNNYCFNDCLFIFIYSFADSKEVYVNRHRHNQPVGKWSMKFLCEKFDIPKATIMRSGEMRHGALEDAETLKKLVKKMMEDSLPIQSLEEEEDSSEEEKSQLLLHDVELFNSTLRIYNL